MCQRGLFKPKNQVLHFVSSMIKSLAKVIPKFQSKKMHPVDGGGDEVDGKIPANSVSMQPMSQALNVGSLVQASCQTSRQGGILSAVLQSRDSSPGREITPEHML